MGNHGPHVLGGSLKTAMVSHNDGKESGSGFNINDIVSSIDPLAHVANVLPSSGPGVCNFNHCGTVRKYSFSFKSFDGKLL